jgi:hypothetical protein
VYDEAMRAHVNLEGMYGRVRLAGWSWLWFEVVSIVVIAVVLAETTLSSPTASQASGANWRIWVWHSDARV